MSSSLMMCCCLLLLFSLLSEGREILVGGKSNTWSWKVPESTEETLNQWSERTRFKIGDTLLWKYNAENDSVLQVKEKDYERCDRSEPMRGYKDGHTKIELNRPGPFYFISGEEGHCQRGEKLRVVVLSPNHNRSVVDAPAPAPVNVVLSPNYNRSNVDAGAPLNAHITNKGNLNRAWSLLLLLLPLGLLV
ncbi:PREDICTED: early nodulin-like protein 1 [Camelina sativa]|uniref:Early nodulin-like protein 1 n=1 Tax=Camelina sativa TaxID=90675 RepID=A0ABM0UMW8_CAMSA|nr:PREDICTED: early nodulin-like protein 1 [Camelina sativa]XP_010443502.1 PREDICTED: early nodulin-like protein 1 [Camelina sativa]XP_010497472.1 PREDICTED: early nodulin-like protein 1 [Camelina sativa]